MDFTYKGYKTLVEYAPEDKIYFGKIDNINDLVLIEGKTGKEFFENFKYAVEEYLKIKK